MESRENEIEKGFKQMHNEALNMTLRQINLNSNYTSVEPDQRSSLRGRGDMSSKVTSEIQSPRPI